MSTEKAGRVAKSAIQTPFSVLGELMRILPDSLLLGSGFFALVTLSFSYAIFFVSMLEGLFAFHGIRHLNNYLNIINVVPLRQSLGPACRTGFTTLSAASLSLFANMIRPTFPSAPMFIMGLASTYVVLSMNVLSKEMEAMGSEYTSRYYISATGLGFLTFFVAAYRVRYACDSIGSAAISVLLGAIVAGLLVVQNQRIFGESSLNLVGVPLLRQRTASGEKLYICPTQSKV
jgi:hypothetical protein